MSNAAAFLAAVRGIPANHVAKALTSMVGGAYYSTACTKATMARCYENGCNPRWTDTVSCALRRLDLDTLARRARARMAGDSNWRAA